MKKIVVGDPNDEKTQMVRWSRPTPRSSEGYIKSGIDEALNTFSVAKGRQPTFE